MSLLKHYKVESNKDAKINFVFLHGYGANGRDLVGLSQHPGLKSLEANWYFLEAPLSPPELAMFGGRSWFSITLSSLGPGADLKDFYDQEHKEIDSSFSQIKESLWDLNIDLKNTYIGGFSQGAMMASKVFFDTPSDFKGLISLSGAALHRKKWNISPKNISTKNNTKENTTDSDSKNDSSTKQKVFLSHGKQDPVLPFSCATDLDDSVVGFNKKSLWFNGGHEIPPQVLKELSSFIKA
jgi:phospholipase/carboxylesterase